MGWGLLGIGKRRRSGNYNPVAAYRRHLRSELRFHRKDRDLAFAVAVGSLTLDLFCKQGDAHVAVLKHHGLRSGMAVYDLGCGCGRTAQALQRSGWEGSYVGADIIPKFIKHLKEKCPGFNAYVHTDSSIRAADDSIDLLYHWSVFTHVPAEDCYLYMEDSFRALKPGGKLIFSFLDFGDPEHRALFDRRVLRAREARPMNLLDTFLHPDWIRLWAQQIGFESVSFTDGKDGTNHPPFWQSLAAMQKPARWSPGSGPAGINSRSKTEMTPA